MSSDAQAQRGPRYQPDEKCPPLLGITSALQIFVPNTIGLVMLVGLVVRASGQSDAYLAWATFTVLAASGVGMILQALQLRYLGSGALIVCNFNVPFLAVSVLALQAGGPGLLATLIIASTLLQTVLTFRLASLRRIFTQTVSGVIVMLVAVSAVPFIITGGVIKPEGMSTALFLAPGAAALVAGAFILLKDAPAWRMWILPGMVAVGLVVALPLGFYDVDLIIHAPWLSLSHLRWPGLDLSFGADFWTLLPVFVFVKLTAFVYVRFTGVAARSVGIYLGLFTIAIAPFSKLLALLTAVPSQVVGAVYIVIFGSLFVEGAKSVFSDPVDQKKAAIAGVATVLGLSAGVLSAFFEGTISSHLVGNTIVVGGVVAVAMTLFTELPSFRARKLRIDLSQSSLPAIDHFLAQFADRHSWSEQGKNRLRLVGEEAVLSLLEAETQGPASQQRRLIASIHPDGAAAELEITVAADDAIQGNIEDRIAYLGDDRDLEDERHLSVRILRHYASSVHHRQYYGLDIISCRVDQ